MSRARRPSRLTRPGRALLAGTLALLARAYWVYHRTLRLHGLMPDGTVIHHYRDFGECREIVSLCERDALAIGGFLAGRGYITLVAHGRDGDWAAAALQALGCRVVRGSSGRGGASAGKALVRLFQSSPGPAAMVVDGPAGPSGLAKPGVALCAQLSDRPMRPVAGAARFSVVFSKTWSRLYLPLPFSRLVVGIGEPVTVAGSSAEERESATQLLNERLAAARQQALDVVHAR